MDANQFILDTYTRKVKIILTKLVEMYAISTAVGEKDPADFEDRLDDAIEAVKRLRDILEQVKDKK